MIIKDAFLAIVGTELNRQSAERQATEQRGLNSAGLRQTKADLEADVIGRLEHMTSMFTAAGSPNALMIEGPDSERGTRFKVNGSKDYYRVYVQGYTGKVEDLTILTDCSGYIYEDGVPCGGGMNNVHAHKSTEVDEWEKTVFQTVARSLTPQALTALQTYLSRMPSQAPAPSYS
jgi:hypothetical protein